MDWPTGPYRTILADPPWRFRNRGGIPSPEYGRVFRYSTMPTEEIGALSVGALADEDAHLYLWVPTAMLPDGLTVLAAWGFEYKTTMLWVKVGRDRMPSIKGMGWYFRNAAEPMLFGVRGKMRTLAPARRQANVFLGVTRGHSRKPPEAHELIERCSPGPYLELFARAARRGWDTWGNEVGRFAEQDRLTLTAPNGK